MIYTDFIKKVRDISYFKPEHLAGAGNIRTLNNQLANWQKDGKVRKLKKGIYTLNDDDRRAPLTAFAISNVLYPPSYISMESALAFWGLIPERVAQVVALTPRKTALFKNFYGLFRYRNIKKNLFFGFVSVKDEAGLPVIIATPEKTILDKIYFDPSFRTDEEYFLENLRLQNYERLSKKRLKKFAKQFSSEKVRSGAVILASLIDEERK